MNILNLPGSRALLIAMVVTGLFLAPAAMADVAGSMSYGMKGISGATSAQPAYSTVSGPYALGSVSAYGVVSSRSPSQSLDYKQTVSASGKITSFSFSFHYEG